MNLSGWRSLGARSCTIAIGLMLTLAAVGDCRRIVRAGRAFYYWRTSFALSDAERLSLTCHHINRLYVRFFDVGWSSPSNRAVPAGRCRFSDSWPEGIEMVPVVYLTNEVLRREPSPPALAAGTWRLVRSMTANAGLTFRELQVDCDWTDETRAAFFEFCRELKRLGAPERLLLSATIRLHQVKYWRRTGLPPVDRGMLMFYNVGTIAAGDGPMSIWNLEAASRYVSSIDRYPLPLDGALAVFGWAVHARDGEVVGLIGKADAAALDEYPWLQRTAEGRYTAVEPAFYRGTYLRCGDTLTIEAMTPVLAQDAARLLAEHLDPSGGFVALFDLDERNLRHYEPHELEVLFPAVR